MTTYTITADGIDMGDYEGNTEAEAITAYVNDMGYATVAQAADVLGKTEAEFLAEITVTEIN